MKLFSRNLDRGQIVEHIHQEMKEAFPNVAYEIKRDLKHIEICVENQMPLIVQAIEHMVSEYQSKKVSILVDNNITDQSSVAAEMYRDGLYLDVLNDIKLRNIVDDEYDDEYEYDDEEE